MADDSGNITLAGVLVLALVVMVVVLGVSWASNNMTANNRAAWNVTDNGTSASVDNATLQYYNNAQTTGQTWTISTYMFWICVLLAAALAVIFIIFAVIGKGLGL